MKQMQMSSSQKSVEQLGISNHFHSLEAIRQMKSDLGHNNVMYIHCTLVPYIKAAGELKTKPTQHSVKELRSLGIQPNIIVVRTEMPISQDMKDKIALFCDIDKKAVIECLDADTLYCHSSSSSSTKYGPNRL